MHEALRTDVTRPHQDLNPDRALAKPRGARRTFLVLDDRQVGEADLIDGGEVALRHGDCAGFGRLPS